MRTISALIYLLGVVLLSTVEPLLSQEKITSEQISKAVQQLSDKRFAVREKASKLLFEAGLLAEKPLQEALKSTDPDVVNRAQSILDRFSWGIFSDTDPKVVEQVENFRKGDRAISIQAIEALLQIKPVPFRTLRKLFSQEVHPEQQRIQTDKLGEFAHREIPILLQETRFSEVEEIFELLLTASMSHYAPDYAVFMEMTKRLDEAITRFKKITETENPSKAAAHTTLAYLYRAKGDWPNCEKEARLSDKAGMIPGVYVHSGNWKELHKVAINGPNNPGYHLYLARLADDQPRRDACLKTILDTSEKVEPDQLAQRTRWKAVALLMNGYVDEAMKMLSDSETQMELQISILIARHQYRDALAAIEKALTREKDDSRKAHMQLVRARLLYQLGDRDTAIQHFKQLATAKPDRPLDVSLYALVRAEIQVGLREMAVEQFANYFQFGDDPEQARINEAQQLGAVEGQFDLFFPERSQLASEVWRGIQKTEPKESFAKRFHRLDRLLAGKDKEALTRLAETWPKDDPDTRLLLPQIARTLAELHLLHGNETEAIRQLKFAIGKEPQETFSRLGDHYFRRQKYELALEAYAQEAKEVRSSIVTRTYALAMQGRCLQMLGKKAEGQVVIDRAFWMPLSQQYVRNELMERFQRINWPEAAAREAEMILRSEELSSWPSFSALYFLASYSNRQREYRRASECYLRTVLGVLDSNGEFVEDSGFISAPDAVEVGRGMHLLKQGKIDEAVAVARRSLVVHPGDLDAPIAFVPALDRLKKEKEANEIYQSSKAVFTTILKDYPKSCYALNSLAWLMAACRRDLDEALKYAQRAVELEPTHHGYLDTLAEVHFRRGDKAKAIALMEKCIAMEPGKSYYRKQLHRFENLGIDSDAPDEE
jgi:tetratricopeptide (TPR) repeat protein